MKNLTKKSLNLEKIKAIIFDIDNTLVYGKSTDAYYSQYSIKLEQSIAQHLNISVEEGKGIADQHRKKFNGMGEKVFETYNIPFSVFHDAICELDPKPHLYPNLKINQLLQRIKDKNIILGAITDSPIIQAKKVLQTVTIDISLFDFCIGWERHGLPPKAGKPDVYLRVAKELHLQPHEILMVGDSLGADIIPAQSVGYQTFQVSENNPTELLLNYLN